MDFDLSKENIQPLRRGRNVHQLEVALQAQTNPEYQTQLQQEKEQFESLIRNYQGDDPLQNYYEYITWIEQVYPKNGHEGNCNNLVEHCLQKFEDDARYTNDIRFCKLWIKYIDSCHSPLELYSMMKSKNLCTGCAEFYKAWAYYYEAAGEYRKANAVLMEGMNNCAQPYDELETAHRNLVVAIGEHELYGPNENRLQERRQALISLKSYRSGMAVNSVRVPSGRENVHFPSGPRESANAQVNVYCEDQAAMTWKGGAAPKSIITVAKRQEAPKENTLKPGPWTTVPQKKRLASGVKHAAAAFTVLEDDDVPVGCLPPNLPQFAMEDFSTWIVSLVNCPDPESATTVFGYPKHRVYCEPNVEYSIEEIRAARYEPTIIAVQSTETNEAVQSILVDDDEDDVDCFVVVPDPPEMEVSQDFHVQENFQTVASPLNQPSAGGTTFVPADTTSTVSQSPWKSAAEYQSFMHDVFSKSNEHRLSAVPPKTGKFEILEDPEPSKSASEFAVFETMSPPPKLREFAVFEQSSHELPPQAPPKGSAMKTAFRTLNADEVETGSRGGMDGALAAQPLDGARPMAHVLFSDSSSSSLGDVDNGIESFDCTQQFNVNLNAMKVSTPQSKDPAFSLASTENAGSARKALFGDAKLDNDKALSTILEEKSGFGSSGSSGATTKSFLQPNNHLHKISTISEEHNSYLEQNMKANEALRRSLLGELVDDVLPAYLPQTAPAPSSPMQSTPLQSPVRKLAQPTPTQALDYVPPDPFNASLISQLLNRVSFPGNHSHGYVQIDNNPRVIVKKEPTFIGRDAYTVEKILGKGQFGTVYKAYNHQMSCTVALKYQKPPNKWEFYICRELQARLANHPLKDRFMDISVGYFSDHASVLVSRFEPFGSLLDTANVLKHQQVMPYKAKEHICMYFTLQMLEIVKAMHQVKIIHADIKPDNFLVYLLPDNSLGLQLIDFGCSIDMTLFPENAMFTVPISTEDFICCEVRDRRPWSYHTDLFCVAATAHVLVFHEYIQLRKIKDVWSINSRLPRHVNHELWFTFFNNLLNQQSGPADVAPLEMLFREALEPVRIDLFSRLNTLVNMLKNR